MVAVADSGPTELFGRHRFRGLDPKSVELWANNFAHENALLRSQVAALEARATKADAFAEDAIKEMVSLQEIVKRTDADQAVFVARQRLFREEAAHVVHDAWAEANVVQSQTQHVIERTQAQLAAAKNTHAQYLDAMREKMMDEIDGTIAQVRAVMSAEYAEHQARIVTLERERMRLITEIERCTASVLTMIGPLKQKASATDQAAGAVPQAVCAATDVLATLPAVMERSLRTPALDERPMALTIIRPHDVAEFDIAQ